MFNWLKNLFNPKPLPEVLERSPEYVEELKLLLIQDLEHPKMYRLQWPDGVQSADMYNLTWAKEHKRRIERNEQIEGYQITAAIKPLEAH